MKRHACALAFVAFFAVRTAAACPNLTIEADERALVPIVEAAFATRDDIDTCARVVITSHGRRIVIAVTLPDGRTATRTVSRREDVVGALEALLRMPASSEQDPTEESASDIGAPLPPLPLAALLAPSPEPRDVIAPTPAATRPRLGADLGVGTSARLGDRSSVGVGAIFLFDVRSWLIGAQGRVDRYTTSEETQSHAGVSLTAIGGRRLHFDTMSLDLFTGAGLRTQHEQQDVPFLVQRPYPGSPPPPPPASRPPPGSSITIRSSEQSSNGAPELVFGTRLNFRARSVLRAFVQLDGAVGPSWSFGLMVGAAVGS